MDKLINSVERALANENWYAALVTAITFPDIAGKIEFPVSKTRYGDWFNKYMGNKYKFLSGNDCYALRCSLLHEGLSSISHQKAQEALDDFQFNIPRLGVMHNNLILKEEASGQIAEILQLQVDIFCRDMVEGIRNWLTDISTNEEKTSALRQFLSVKAFSELRLGEWPYN